MPKLIHSGVEIFYTVEGKGPAVLLTHGFCGSSAMWRAQIKALQSRYTVITWDMRGHAQSSSPKRSSAYSVALSLTDMNGILDACGVERAVIGGFSLGGLISLDFYLKYPQRVNGLLLVDTGPGFRSVEAQRKWNEGAKYWARLLETHGLGAFEIEPQLSGTDTHQAIHSSTQGLALAARGGLKRSSDHVIRSIKDISVPTLVIVGANDKPFLGAADYMARKIPGSQKVVIAGAGHASNLDQPELFNRAVKKFLNNVPMR
ncbi:alpha/beta hydrolase [Marinobacter salarius]|uniref:alpha/beta fold hydrolase n=1 Tax=Marinobacter salarius TaxID=1420917 RepID=UPI00273C397D|nr:alpha/beta hydrolase [Marinobacter salarius]MDP4534100.1 alpha/beta hydrolase [Marinobacter salarius]